MLCASSAQAGKILDAIMGVDQNRQDEIYRQRYIENVEAINSLNKAKSLREETALIEAETGLRYQLIDMWKSMGMSDEEAKSVAASFVLNNELFAHVERAKREGFTVTLAAAKTAYHNRQYLLANQLLIAATRQDIPNP